MSRKREFKHISYQDSESIAKYLDELKIAIKKGHVYFKNAEEELSLRPEGLLNLEIKAHKKKEKSTLRLKISWKHLDLEEKSHLGDLKITGGGKGYMWLDAPFPLTH